MLRCEVEGCEEGEGGTGKGFDHKKALLIHLGMEHGMWRCTVKQCGFESETSDELKEHRAVSFSWFFFWVFRGDLILRLMGVVLGVWS